MQNLIEQVQYYLDDRHLLEMANMQPRETGLSHIINISHKGGAKHGARVKVSNIAGRYDPSDNFSITLESEPRIIGKCKLSSHQKHNIIDWVKLNRQHLNHIWNYGATMTMKEMDSGFKHFN